MSDTLTPQRTKLWPEALRLFRLHKSEWAKWAVLFFIILAPLNICLSQGAGETIQNFAALFKGDKITPEPHTHFLATFAVMLFGFIQMYVYSVIFLKQESALGVPQISFGGLLFYLGQILLWGLLLMGIVFVCCIPLVIMIVVLTMLKISMEIGVGLTWVIMMVGMCYLIIRYTLVFPLAACRVKSSITRSTQLMRGNMWRVFVNILPVWLVTALFAPINMLFLYKASALLTPGTPESGGAVPLAVISLLLLGILQTVISAIATTFGCAVCTLLVNEKQAVDPAFKLVTSG